MTERIYAGAIACLQDPQRLHSSSDFVFNWGYFDPVNNITYNKVNNIWGDDIDKSAIKNQCILVRRKLRTVMLPCPRIIHMASSQSVDGSGVVLAEISVRLS